MNKWKEVWERLPIEKKDKSLAEISGFDSVCKTEKQLNSFKKETINNLFKEIPKNNNNINIFEVGCGCGDKLKEFSRRGFNCFGIDYSKNMIIRAKKEIPTAQLAASTADIIPFKKKMDFLYCYSVFQYFDSYEYSKKVLKSMVNIMNPGSIICIWDIPDIKKQEIIEDKRGKFKNGYEHRMYDINFFSDWFFKNSNVKFFKVEFNIIPEYLNSLYRFNLTIKLK